MRTIIALVCLLPVLAFGQSTSTRMDPGGETATVTIRATNNFIGRPLTGAPYSAEQVSEHVQTLADGTHITEQQSHQKMWRDSEGRTRTERSVIGGMQAKQGEFVLVEIRDPVSGSFYVIDDQNKVAHRFAMQERPAPVRTPPTAAQKAQAEKFRAEQSNTKLEAQNIEGVIAEGTRFTRTIPVGEMGNDRPIVTSSESWYSQEMQLMVLSKSTDPRYGDQTTRMTNISRAEPDASLFMPPAGYSVVEEKESATVVLKRQ